MAKLREAKADFVQLDQALENWKEAFEYAKINPIKNIVDGVYNDLAFYYGAKEGKSKTEDFLKKIVNIKNILDNEWETFCNKRNKEIDNIKKSLIKKYNNIEFNDYNGKFSCSDSEQEAAVNSEFCELKKGIIQKLVKENINKIKPQLSSLKKEFENFQKTLEKQKKRKIFGHISRFCNDGAINTLKKLPQFFAEYEKALTAYLKTFPDD